MIEKSFSGVPLYIGKGGNTSGCLFTNVESALLLMFFVAFREPVQDANVSPTIRNKSPGKVYLFKTNDL